MSKRVRKKSAKLLESELDGIEDSLLAGGAKKKKKLPAALTSPKPLPKPKPDVTSDKKLVPKLTIKFGGGGKASVANNQKEPAAVSAKTLSTPPRQAEASKKLTPVLVINKSKLTSTTSGGPSEGKQQISDSKKTDTKSATVSPKPSSISSPGGSQGVIKKRQAPKKVTGKPKKQSNFPTDIEIEAPQETSPPLVKKEPTTPKPVKTPKKTNAPKTPVSKASPSIKPVTPKVQTPKLESKPITPKHAVKTELPMAEMSSPEQPSNKRQRKLPAKFAADDYDIDTDLHSINKAAKFFETKKAEAKAATAIAKHEASKSGKKVKRNRMPTAYTMWCNSYRAKLQAQCPGMDFVTMNKKLGEVWWSIPPKEKNCWKRKAKRLATHGAPKKGTDPLKYLGSKAIASLQRNNLLTAKNTKTQNTKKLSTIQNTPPVFKVTQTEPVDVAAHFQMLSDTFKSVGYSLKSNSKVQLSGSLTMLMDSLLCGVSSLMCLTQQVPELDGDTDPQTHRQRQSDIATFIPHA